MGIRRLEKEQEGEKDRAPSEYRVRQLEGVEGLICEMGFIYDYCYCWRMAMCLCARVYMCVCVRACMCMSRCDTVSNQRHELVHRVCVRVCVCACVRMCVCACVCVS